MSIVDHLRAQGLREVINVCGVPSGFGAMGASDAVAAVVAAMLPRQVDMIELQRIASTEIARATGAQAGFVTGCSAAGLAVATAACLTGDDPRNIAGLPDTTSPSRRIVVQGPHDFSCGAPLAQIVALTGARLLVAGGPQACSAGELCAALESPHAVAALFVEGTAPRDAAVVPLAALVGAARDRRLPFIVDGAAEHDLRGAIAAGADLFLRSAQKIHRGPTAGIIAGRRELVRACYLQEGGIGRTMKAGKEAVAGTIAALLAWQERDGAVERRAWERRVALAAAILGGTPGLVAAVEEDEHGRGVPRLALAVDAAVSGFTAADLAAWLAAADPQVIVLPWESGRDLLYLDPRPVGDAQMVQACRAVLAGAAQPQQVGGACGRLGQMFDLATRLRQWP
ncbi:MAG: hypothetical protein O3B22_10805 [Proteobacteria bacterium]|nr:hypothetical protein [Pseudomonadota bacterium]